MCETYKTNMLFLYVFTCSAVLFYFICVGFEAQPSMGQNQILMLISRKS